jgi:metal-dependent HD superfamily phosphatase/phosphodiesterase
MTGFYKVTRNPKINTLLKQADRTFAAMGYKKHGLGHSRICAKKAGSIYDSLGLDADEKELAKISAYMHDIGNAIALSFHEMSGAILAGKLLRETGMDLEKIHKITEAVGNHELRDVYPPSAITAAVILADKTDIHKSRVRKMKLMDMDTHARVNLACERSSLRVEKSKRLIELELEIDENICKPMEYFEIFLSRVRVLHKAADFLGCRFNLYINRARYT